MTTLKKLPAQDEMARDDARITTAQLEQALSTLYQTYGVPQLDDSGDDLLGTLIEAILSQSTTNINSARAFEQLMTRFEGDWHQVSCAPCKEVVEAIRCGGLAKQKAPRIQAILHELYGERGDYSLEFLRELEPKAALAKLMAMPGVGPKTARYVLMHAAQAPVFAMDTHILRIARRMGWILPSLSDERAHAAMESIMPEGQHEPAHVVLIWHGRRCCHARHPACTGCPLLASCPHGQATTQGLDL